ncbi:MAG: hypothetical protein ACK5L5_07815, partial [Bacteroidales bacterium]
RMELVGKIYSHVTHTVNLGFKGLFMAYYDRKSLFALDFSMHGEKGKNHKKPYGLTPSQSKKRFSKKRDKSTKGSERKNDFFLTKIESTINKLRLAIKKGVRFDYVLSDSWFTCFELIEFIKTRRIGCYFIGMMSTNLELSFEQAYEIYSTRWSVEVFFLGRQAAPGIGKMPVARLRCSDCKYYALPVAIQHSSCRQTVLRL